MALNYVTVGLDDRHFDQLEKICVRNEMSKTATMRRALRLLYVLEARAAAGYKLAWAKAEEKGDVNTDLKKLETDNAIGSD